MSASGSPSTMMKSASNPSAAAFLAALASHSSGATQSSQPATSAANSECGELPQLRGSEGPRRPDPRPP